MERLTAATTGVREFILSQVVVVEGGYSPLLLPAGVDKLLSTSVQLAALLGQYFIQYTYKINVHVYVCIVFIFCSGT